MDFADESLSPKWQEHINAQGRLLLQGVGPDMRMMAQANQSRIVNMTDNLAREVLLTMIRAGTMAVTKEAWQTMVEGAYAAADALVAERERRAK